MQPISTLIGPYSLALLSTLLLAGCAMPSPRTAWTWTDPGVTPKPYSNLIVFGIAPKPNVRHAYEDNFVLALRTQGGKAGVGHGLLPEGGLGDAQAVKRAIAISGADGVIVTHLLGAQTDRVYVPPMSYRSPELYGRLYPYYQRVYGYVTQPDYYAQFPLLIMETNLYDAVSQKLVWSTRSKTMDPNSEHTTIKDLIRSATRGLSEGGYLAQ
jgi:hypothetical protein